MWPSLVTPFPSPVSPSQLFEAAFAEQFCFSRWWQQPCQLCTGSPSSGCKYFLSKSVINVALMTGGICMSLLSSALKHNVQWKHGGLQRKRLINLHELALNLICHMPTKLCSRSKSFKRHRFLPCSCFPGLAATLTSRLCSIS